MNLHPAEIFQRRLVKVFIVLIALYFVLKFFGLFIVKKVVETTANKVAPIELKIGRLGFSTLSRSVSVYGLHLIPSKKEHIKVKKIKVYLRNFSTKQKKVEMKKINLTGISLTETDNKKLITARLNNLSLNNITLQQTSDDQLMILAELKITNASIVDLKDFLNHHFSIIPKNGQIFVTSKIILKGDDLHTKNSILIKDLDLTSSSISGAGILIANEILSQGRKNKDMSLEFSIDFNLKDKDIDWLGIATEAFVKGFGKSQVKSLGSTIESIIPKF